MDTTKIRIEYQPRITDDQLWEFYVRNDICEVGYGKELAVRPLHYNPTYIAAAFYEDKLVGIIRATFDGLGATIAEFDLELELQGENLACKNGSLIEKDTYGIARRMGQLLMDELAKLGNTFWDAYVVQGIEEDIYHAIGMKANDGHLAFYKDDRPYVNKE